MIQMSSLQRLKAQKVSRNLKKRKKLLTEAVAFTVWRWKIISCGSSCRK